MPDRIIRFTSIVDYDRPRLLSHYNAEKNVIVIDKEEAECLPKTMQDALLFTELEYTRVSNDGMRFIPYDPVKNAIVW